MTTVTAIDPAVSPFDANGVQFAWDSTSLGWLKECPRKYYLSMIEGWRSKSESVHLTFGIHYHSGLEAYDRYRALGNDHPTAVRGMVRDILRDTWIEGENGEPGSPWVSNHPTKNRYTLLRSLVWYTEHFGERDPASTLILANGKPAVELSFRFEAADGLFLCGHLDRVVEFGDELYVMDRKTSGSTLSPTYFSEYSPHNQMTLYTLAGKVITSRPIKGVIIDAAQIAVGFTEFGRCPTHRSQKQLDEFLEGVKGFRLVAEVFTETGFWPMNETACDKYGGCVFRGICSKDPGVRANFLRTDFTQEKRWNPLQPR